MDLTFKREKRREDKQRVNRVNKVDKNRRNRQGRRVQIKCVHMQIPSERGEVGSILAQQGSQKGNGN